MRLSFIPTNKQTLVCNSDGSLASTSGQKCPTRLDSRPPNPQPRLISRHKWDATYRRARKCLGGKNLTNCRRAFPMHPSHTSLVGDVSPQHPRAGIANRMTWNLGSSSATQGRRVSAKPAGGVAPDCRQSACRPCLDEHATPRCKSAGGATTRELDTCARRIPLRTLRVCFCSATWRENRQRVGEVTHTLL